ncbi:thiolase C-terminal domain-containing protein [Aeromicrobium ginsengisoli]|uniref:Transporter n=1 Tax=Aeromicrobium ginsengisoli TaxID=363867 RepID=A0A5M4F8Z6_9ACTN|nr:transporter [Aeromicrobium ginsengisoli]KAA1394250.1 transporter [Aeromicrobium ginsengisoli]
MTIRGAAAVVGVADLHHPRGKAPRSERGMLVEAVVAACRDAGISPRDVDGFTSYAGGDNSGPVLAAELGIRELRWSTMVWGGGGGGSAASIVTAAAAIASGQADCVVAVRSMAQAATGRLGYAKYYFDHQYLPHGVATPAHVCALRTQRLLEHDGVPRSAMRNLVLAAYHHAQANPDAAAYGKPLTAEAYDESAYIVEPFHLYDCSRENDGAVALVLVSAERARQLDVTPAYVIGGAQGSVGAYAARNENDAAYTTAGGSGTDDSPGVASRVWQQAGIKPSELDVVQVYENFSGPAVASLMDHGLCPAGPASGDFLTLDNLIAPHGVLPVNTSGGNVADSFVNGMGLAVEAVRQIRGTSSNQIGTGVDTSLYIGGPMAPIHSSVLLGSATTL